MASAEFSFDTEVLPVVRQYAEAKFAIASDRESLVCDTISVAWESYQRQPAAPPKSIAYYAVRHVRVGRQFRQSIRSIDGPNPSRVLKPHRAEFDLRLISRPGDNPADWAALRLDYPEWYASLKDRQRAMLDAFLTGDTTAELAKRFACSPGRVSQLRRELLESWQMFTA